jgi:3-hydroxyisobutyrate dehydrogenase-like beta-hydroxyacid dehydrogenase
MTQVEDVRAESRPRAGVIGLGMIGGGVAVSLARRGRVPAVYDIRPDAADGLKGVPALVASPAEVARDSDVVLLAVMDAGQARDVLTGENGLLTAGRENLIVVLLSTVSIADVKALATLCAEHSATLLDAGVTGGAQAARNGLVAMVGGPDDEVEYAMPVLTDFARAVVHCGPLGTGMVTKLARNAVIYAAWVAVREAAAIAVSGGVPLERLVQVMEAGDDDATAPLFPLKLRLEGHDIPADKLEDIDAIFQKDLSAAQRLAAETGLETPIIDMVRPRARAAFSADLPDALPEDLRERGRRMMDRVYGEGISALFPEKITSAPVLDILEHLFAEVWSRPHLTIRDRRLLVLGATAAQGHREMLEIQLRGAMANGEFTNAQLREAVLMLMKYAGVANGSIVQNAVEQLITARAKQH